MKISKNIDAKKLVFSARDKNICEIANDNSEGQVVISGSKDAVKRAVEIAMRDVEELLEQNDLPEFLLFIIDAFHTAIMREVEMNIKGNSKNDTDKLAVECYKMMKNMYSKEFSEILQIFYGIILYIFLVL